MRRIERTGVFRNDFKREKRGRYRNQVEEVLSSAVSLLASDKGLPVRNRDHALSGDWQDCRECHLKPNSEVLQLVRMGSHSELF